MLFMNIKKPTGTSLVYRQVFFYLPLLSSLSIYRFSTAKSVSLDKLFEDKISRELVYILVIMTTFLLLRHGTRVSRSEDTSLSNVGIQQAIFTAHYLQNRNISYIYASPLKRTQQTASIIARHLKLPVITDNRLSERMIFDKTKGLTFEEFLKEWDKTMINRTYQPLYGDSSVQAGQRLKTVLDEISNDKVNLIVTHAGIIGDGIRTIFTDKRFSFLSDQATGAKWIQIAECSITEIIKEGSHFKIKRFNDTSHLKENN